MNTIMATQLLETNFSYKLSLYPFDMKSNQEKFLALRQLNLPVDQYAVTGSGPLGIRDLKAIGDIDIIVSLAIWNDLAQKFGITSENGVEKIVIPGGIIEVFKEGSFSGFENDKEMPSVDERIANAEIIDGLPFESLENTLYFKYKQNREKDLKDIKIIERLIDRDSKEHNAF